MTKEEIEEISDNDLKNAAGPNVSSEQFSHF